MKIYQPMFLFFFVMVIKESYGCDDPLGMESGEIKNSEITASSYHGRGFHAPSNARLHMQPIEGKSDGAWSAGSLTILPWVQIDLGSVKKVTAIATQGHPVQKQWVKRYVISYGNDPMYFTTYMKPFRGNTDSNTVVKNKLNPPIVARYIRVMAYKWQWWPSMRIELYGCAVKEDNQEPDILARG